MASVSSHTALAQAEEEPPLGGTAKSNTITAPVSGVIESLKIGASLKRQAEVLVRVRSITNVACTSVA